MGTQKKRRRQAHLRRRREAMMRKVGEKVYHADQPYIVTEARFDMSTRMPIYRLMDLRGHSIVVHANAIRTTRDTPGNDYPEGNAPDRQD